VKASRAQTEELTRHKEEGDRDSHDVNKTNKGGVKKERTTRSFATKSGRQRKNQTAAEPHERTAERVGNAYEASKRIEIFNIKDHNGEVHHVRGVGGRAGVRQVERRLAIGTWLVN